MLFLLPFCVGFNVVLTAWDMALYKEMHTAPLKTEAQMSTVRTVFVRVTKTAQLRLILSEGNETIQTMEGVQLLSVRSVEN